MLRLKREIKIGALKIWDMKDGERISFRITAEMSPMQRRNSRGVLLYDIHGRPAWRKLGTPFKVHDEKFVLEHFSGLLEKVEEET